jgi:hypothetical protein
MYEKLKGEKSFYSPIFDISERSYTVLDWTPEELDMV